MYSLNKKLNIGKIFAVMLFGLVFMLAGCNVESTSQQQESSRDSNMDRAHTRVPVPQPRNFVTREMVAEYMKRMDVPNKLFYIYILADNGNMIGYYVSRGHPVNICTFMTPPDRVERGPNNRFTRQAPAIDGLYYGSGACNTEYFLDAETDVLIMVRGLNAFISEQPLDIDVPVFRVKVED